MYWLYEPPGPEGKKREKQIESKMKAQLNGSSNIIKKARRYKSEGEN